MSVGTPNVSSPPTCAMSSWYRQRILFLMAGTVTLLGVVVGVLVSPWFLLLPAMAGLNQLLMVSVGWCPMSLLLARLGVPDAPTRAGV